VESSEVEKEICLEELIIAPMRISDLGECMVIERASFSTPWPRFFFIGQLLIRRSCYLVARLSGRIVGYIGGTFGRDGGHIANLAVHPSFRRRGIGERLLLAMFSEAISRSARRLTLEVRCSNLIAQELYEKYGFRKIEVYKGYYHDTGEDAFLMMVDLTHYKKAEELKS